MSADLRLAGAALGCWLAAIGSLFLPAWGGWALAGGALLVAVARPGGPARWVVVAVAAGVACGSAATAARIGERDAEPLRSLAARHATVAAGLRIADDPRLGRPHAGRDATVMVPARLDWIGLEDGRRVTLSARVLVLAGDRGWLGLLPGQAAEATARLSPAGGGDLQAALLSVGSGPRLIGAAPWVQRAAGVLRAGLQRACQGLPAEPGGLLPGLVVGDTSRLDPALDDDFRATGLTHLTAVSGANLAILVGLVLAAVRWCRAGPRVAAIVCVVALVGFVVLVRPSPSVLRAAAMGGLALVALALGRPRAVVPSLAAGVLGLVVADPALAVDAGFALSVLATAGLVLVAPRWTAALQERGWPRFAAEALAVPAAAQAACSPVIAAISASVSLTTVPANLLAAPAVAPATVAGLVSAVLSPLLPSAAAFAAWLASWPARWLVLVAHRGADVPAGLLPWPGGVVGGLLLGGLVAGLLIGFRWPVVRRWVLVVAVAAVLGAVPVRLLAPGWPPPGWLIVACDVGQGDALAVAAGPGAAVVVDAGPEPDAVDGCLRRLGVERVPLLVISHFHVDHVGGLEGVLRGRAVGGLLAPAFAEPAGARAAVLRRGLAPVAGPSLTVGGVRIDVLGPVRTVTGTNSDPNNNSLVLAATTGGLRVLLTGDAENEEQLSLMGAPGLLRADVLKVAHHGSAYQEGAFLDAVRPRIALVSVGAGNTYGHPNPAVLDRLARGGAQVMRTDRSGDLAVVRDGDGRLAVAARGA
ncbi:ComEC/Rec2 family competence protein [Dactylosporangium matsuzakiense]|uniref:ComEC/Rec2 family competence protein n=1 Tax=Dactylosporangium matsuzakiense TaxID=53360 RepID=UPI0021C3E066|nr:ComEC/Rec2 family competence protein [Dactylosporangium matsuzakiense]UWZ43955.1 ComEC/Rec2 family competence protein [Dactylosporangium matsuzakiense]